MDEVETFLRAELALHPRDLAEHAARRFGRPLDEVQGRIAGLVSAGEFERHGPEAASELRWRAAFRARLVPGLQEDRIWREHVAPRLGAAPDNVVRLLHYGTTEMVNNVLDHSGAHELVVVVRRLADSIEIDVEDDGQGIFAKLQRECYLEDPRHVALELSKGRLTTDPGAHTGEGIFFTARMCDSFLIWSDSTVCGQVGHEAWHVQVAEPRPGTTVRMLVRLDSALTPQQVFEEFAPPDREHAFTRTAIQVDLVQHDGKGLFSRSQAKRLLARCESFEEILLDFRGIESIGPAFADEIFRVFAAQHPGVRVEVTGASQAVARTIARARGPEAGPAGGR